jgi:hypothetical protein
VVGLLEGLNVIRVTATDFAGNKSTPVTLQITYRVLDPPNDFFANASVLTGLSDIVTVNTLNATKESGEPNHAGNPGGKSAWWVFTTPADGTLTLSTTNSTFDTLLAIYTGTNVSNLTHVASNDDAYPGALGGFSELVQAVHSGQTYRIAVDGYDGTGGAVFLTYSFVPSTLYHLTVTSTSGGSVSPSSIDVQSNGTVIVSAIPNANYVFDIWSGDALSLANPLAVTVRTNMTITAHFVPLFLSDGFESGNLLHLGWTGAGSAPWFVESTNVASGGFAARSGVIAKNQTSSLILTTNFVAGNGAFDYRVSSELAFDFLKFFVDGAQVQQWSGDVGWTSFAFPLTTGTHTLEWRYAKDPSGSSGFDAALIDNVVLPIAVAKNSTTPARLQWVHGTDGTIFINILGQTNQFYILQTSADLIHWQDVSTGVASFGFIRVDPGSLTSPAQFYRAVSP